MPITPRFQLSQSETHLLIHVVVKHIRVTSVQVAVTTNDDHQLVQIAAPPIYILRLPFPLETLAPLEEEEIVLSSWDPDDLDASAAANAIVDGKVTLRLRKQNPGVHWEDVDLSGKVAAAGSSAFPKTSRWIQEVVETTATDATTETEHSGTATAEQPEQEQRGRYGFGRLFCDVFTDANRDGLAKEMLELPWDCESGGLWDVEQLSEVHAARRLHRMEIERNKFDPDRYLGDWIGAAEDSLFNCAMEYSPAWAMKNNQLATLTDVEQTVLAQIPYPLISTTLPPHRLVLALLDILFAFAYNDLFTTGDPTVESAWTISTVSATLATLEDWSDDTADVATVVYSSLRRSLVYPYLRHCDLGLRAWHLVAQALQHGRREALRCLLRTRKILHASELYYLGNTLFVDPYLAWLQEQQPSSGADRQHPLDAVLCRAGKDIEAVLAQSLDSIKRSLELNLLDWEAMTLEEAPDEQEASCNSNNAASTASDDDSDTTSKLESHGRKDDEFDGHNLSTDLLNLTLEDSNPVSLFSVEDGEARPKPRNDAPQNMPLVKVISSEES